jgi:hypothetical protein
MTEALADPGLVRTDDVIRSHAAALYRSAFGMTCHPVSAPRDQGPVDSTAGTALAEVTLAIEEQELADAIRLRIKTSGAENHAQCRAYWQYLRDERGSHTAETTGRSHPRSWSAGKAERPSGDSRVATPST